MRFLAVLLLISLAVGASANWKCGARPEDSAVAEKAIGFLCPSRKEMINTCCVEHDACYRKKTGRKPCDDQFDNCTMKSSRGTFCVPVMKLFVSLVRTFGGISYKGLW